MTSGPPVPQRSLAVQILGFVLGLAVGGACFFLIGTLTNSAWGVGVVLLLLVVGSVVVLRRPALRTAAAGLLAGVALGVIVFAGACGGLVALILGSLAGR